MIDRLNAALSDRYRVERELGEGGMATVFEVGLQGVGSRFRANALRF